VLRRGIAIGDFHFGLKTDEIDRTNEIFDVMMFIVQHAVKIKAEFFVFGGDVFDSNVPGDYLIKLFIKCLNVLVAAKIRVFVMVGNHELTASHARRSCLSFVEELNRGGYPNVELIDSVKTIKMWSGVNGDTFFTFLPCVSKSHLNKEKYSSVQEYYDLKAAKIMNKLSGCNSHFVFSHLNLEEGSKGSEEFSLKKLDVVVPSIFLKRQKIGIAGRPTVVNFHIHSKQQMENITVVGSPLFVTFGEKEKEKFCLQLNINDIPFGEEQMTWVKVPCRPMLELDINMNEKEPDKDERRLIEGFAKKLTNDSIVKLNVTCSEYLAATYTFEKFRENLMRHCFYVKPIVPRVIRKRIKRNRLQTLRMNPKDAVGIWLKSNNPKRASKIQKIANNLIDSVL